MSNASKKISVIGAGNVGATVAYALSVSGIAPQLALVDIAADKAAGEVMDIEHAASMLPGAHYITGDYDVTDNSDIVVITAGMGRKPGMTRIDLCNTNIKIIMDIVPKVVKHSPNAVYVIVSNPADVLTYATLKLSGLPENQIIGSGTLLDTSRLRTGLAQQLGVNAHDVNAYVLGEHGDTSVVPWSLANIFGMNVVEYAKANGMADKVTAEELERLTVEMRKGGANVIARKGATFYAIALAVREICEAVLGDTKRVLPVCTMMNGEYGISDVALSIPCQVGANGIDKKPVIQMTDTELAQLQASSEALKKVISELTL